jgi:hypothetical protein
MYSVLHLPINCELTEQGERYSHIRLTFPTSKPNPTSQCQLCKQWLLGVKTPGVSIELSPDISGLTVKKQLLFVWLHSFFSNSHNLVLQGKEIHSWWKSR